MSDKTATQQQQTQPQLPQPSPWAAAPWQQQAYQQYYAQQGANNYGMAYNNYYQQPYYTAQQQIAFTNANNALLQNGINNLGSFNTAQTQNNSQNKANNILPPLPPGPPPPLMGGQTYQPPASTNCDTSTTATSSYYGQAQNLGFPQIQFKNPANKTGLGFKPMTITNNSGGAKKKRKKNKMARMFPVPACFESAGSSQSFPGNHPPLPKDVPPPFPPLPPPPPLPTDPPPPPSSPMSNKPPSPATMLGQTGKFSSSPLLPTPPKKWNENLPNITSEPWPDSLKAYVNRCYAQCVKDVDKDQVEIILKGKITTASTDGSLWEKNWDFEPLPSLFSERNTIEIKKPAFANNRNNGAGKAGAQRGPAGFTLGKRGRGLSASMGSRLGGFGRGQQRRSKSRSFSPSGRLRSSARRSRSRSRTRSRSHSRSPARRHRKDRRSSDSSTSSDENFKPLEVKKKRGNGRMNNRMESPNFSPILSKRARKKQKMENKKNHFYSELGTLGDVPVNNERLQKRAARFQATIKNTAPAVQVKGRKKTLNVGNGNSSGNFYQDSMISDVDWKKFHIVGTCMDVDKQYLRQTTAPDASTIRPVEVLRKSLVAVQERWKRDQDYFFACDRLKSIRLDLTLQGIRNEFTVKVYETHARIALEKGDHQELNQCLSQLSQLYTEVGGANRLEFVAYGILYYVFTKDTLELTTHLAKLSDADKADECVAHAIGVRTAWINNDYHRFFKLYKNAPKMAGYAMELFVERERLAALKIMIKAYRPVLPVSYVTTELGFESTAKCLEFLTPLALVFADPMQTGIECKLSTPIVTKC